MPGDLDDPHPGRNGSPLSTAAGPHPDRLEIFHRPDPPTLTPPTGPPTPPNGRLLGPRADPAPPVAKHGLRNGLLSIALFLLATAGLSATLLLRSEGVRPWRVLWAEDGSRFLSYAASGPGPSGVLEPYAGYLHVLPRLIAAVAAEFPLIHAAKIFAFASSGLAAAALLIFALGLKRWLPSLWMRVGLGAAIGLAHTTASEISANAANLHWFFSLALCGIALRRPERFWTAALLAQAALLLALSDPFSPVLALLALADAVRRTWTTRAKAMPSWPVAIAMSVGAGLQIATMFTDPRSDPDLPTLARRDVVALYVSRVVRDGIGPDWLVRYSLDQLALAVAALAAILAVLGVTVAGARRSLGGNAVAGLLLCLASPAVFAISVLTNGTVADRYAALPVALLITGLLVLAAGVPKVGKGLFALGAAGVITLGAFSWSTAPDRGEGPDYVNAVRTAERDDCPTPATIVPIGLAPVPVRWFAQLPCDRLLDGPHSLPGPLGKL